MLAAQALSAEQARPAAAAAPTLLYLPHCESDFTAAVVRVNTASADALRSIAVLGALRTLNSNPGQTGVMTSI